MATNAPAVRTAADILGHSAQPRTPGKSQATAIEQSRAVAEVQGALTVAHARPRDKAAALNEALESCRTREVAESAFFKFSRAGASVSGESIHLARELARCWGNILYNIAELDRDDEQHRSEMVAFAWDLETNAQARLSFIVPHIRDTKSGPKRLADMRDIYENNANMGARRLRECIFAVLPPYLVKAAADECRGTLEKGESEEPLPVRVSKLLAAFAAIGIDKARIEAKHGPVDRFTPVDLANLRVSYQSIKRAEITADEEFPRPENGAQPTSKLDMLEESIPPSPAAAEGSGEAPTQASEDAADSDAVEGRADSDMGETTTLESALAEIDSAVLVTDVDARMKALLPLLSEEDGDKVRTRAMERIEEMKAKS